MDKIPYLYITKAIAILNPQINYADQQCGKWDE